jgi:hypothetical protein
MQLSVEPIAGAGPALGGEVKHVDGASPHWHWCVACSPSTLGLGFLAMMAASCQIIR